MEKKRVDTTQLTPVEIFNLILKGEVRRFPAGYWKGEEAIKRGIELTNYLVKSILKWPEEELKKNLTEKTFRKYKLSGMLEFVFSRSPYKAISTTYPEKYKAWEFKSTPMNFWNDATLVDAIKWLVNISGKGIKEITQRDFVKYGLSGALNYIYRQQHNSFYYYVNLMYPGKYKQWHLASVPPHFWDSEKNIEEAIKWLIEIKLEIDVTNTTSKNRINADIFCENGLSSIIQKFNGSPYLILNKYYPNLNWLIKKSRFEDETIIPNISIQKDAFNYSGKGAA